MDELEEYKNGETGILVKVIIDTLQMELQLISPVNCSVDVSSHEGYDISWSCNETVND